MPPFPMSGVADAMLDYLRTLSPSAALRDLTGEQLMLERASLAGFTFQSGVSPGGTCRLLPARDLVIALNLPRDDDWSLIPALIQRSCDPPARGDWQQVQSLVADIDAPTLVAQGRALGLAISESGAGSAATAVFEPTDIQASPRAGKPRVVDLSALWAGPLASHLLWLCGADVIKVESSTRPDGARDGAADFYNLLNQGKRSVALNLGSPAGHRTLQALIRQADIVIESSRPRALRQMGVIAEDLVVERPSMTWISLTGYGRQAPEADWIAYGDDAGIAAGMGEYMRRACGTVQFAGDALADPLTGINAACAALSGWQAGGSGLVSISLVDTVAWSINQQLTGQRETGFLEELEAWWNQVQRNPPQCNRRSVSGHVADLGEHTVDVLKALSIPC